MKILNQKSDKSNKNGGRARVRHNDRRRLRERVQDALKKLFPLAMADFQGMQQQIPWEKLGAVNLKDQEMKALTEALEAEGVELGTGRGELDLDQDPVVLLSPVWFPEENRTVKQVFYFGDDVAKADKVPGATEGGRAQIELKCSRGFLVNSPVEWKRDPLRTQVFAAHPGVNLKDARRVCLVVLHTRPIDGLDRRFGKAFPVICKGFPKPRKGEYIPYDPVNGLRETREFYPVEIGPKGKRRTVVATFDAGHGRIELRDKTTDDPIDPMSIEAYPFEEEVTLYWDKGSYHPYAYVDRSEKVPAEKKVKADSTQEEPPKAEEPQPEDNGNGNGNENAA